MGPLHAEERPAAVRVLAAAFRDNPLNVAVIGEGERRRLRANRFGMRALLATAFDHARLLAARSDAGGPSGVLLAVAPRRFPLPPPPTWERVRCAAGQGLRVGRRWARVYETLERVHPVEPHWYLGVLGVAPASQRAGVGSALLAGWLRGVDADAAPAYLETDRPENIAFYGRVGFEVRGELEVLGARVWCMWRPPRRDEGEPGPGDEGEEG